MKNNLDMRKQSGFTLIEIAIVMVIIGLLIGGVLKGQALIDNAKIKSVVNDMKGVQAAWYGYYDRKRVYAPVETSYTAAGANLFWQKLRGEGLLTGDASSTSPALNAMGGSIGVVDGTASTGLAGPVVCTSVLAKFADGIDAALDDGLASTGTVRSNTVGTSLDAAISSPVLTAYPTTGYAVICMQL